MMSLTRSSITTALAMLVASAPAVRAQFGSGRGSSDQHMLRIGFGGGVGVPTSDAKDAFKNGVTGEGFLLVRLGPLPALRINLSYTHFDLKDALTGGGSGSSSLFGGTAGLNLSLINFGPVRPYLTAGLGAFDLRNSVTPAGGTESTKSKVNFGIDAGAGVTLKLGRIDGFVEGKLQNVYTSRGGLIDTKSIKVIPVTFGLIF